MLRRTLKLFSSLNKKTPLKKNFHSTQVLEDNSFKTAWLSIKAREKNFMLESKLKSAKVDAEIRVAQGTRDPYYAYRQDRSLNEQKELNRKIIKNRNELAEDLAEYEDDDLRKRLHLLLAERQSINASNDTNTIFDLEMKIFRLRKKLYPKFQAVVLGNRGAGALCDREAAYRLGFEIYKIYMKVDENAPSTQLVPPQNRLLVDYYAYRTQVQEYLLALKEKTGLDIAYVPGDGGFLSEDGDFALWCEKNGIYYVGPPSFVLKMLANRGPAKEFFKQHGVSIPLSYTCVLEDQDITDIAKNIEAKVGYPCVIKPNLGNGGGKKVYVVNSHSECMSALSSLKTTNITAEEFYENGIQREIQILADHHSKFDDTLSFGPEDERDCSMQLYNQKGLERSAGEEIPGLYQDALKAARAMINLGYVNAGTLEYVISGKKFGLIDINPRRQREAPVTAEGKGIDISEWMLRVAAGKSGSAYLRRNQVKPFKKVRMIRVLAAKVVHNIPKPGEVYFAGLQGTVTKLKLPSCIEVYKDSNNQTQKKVIGKLMVDAQVGTQFDCNPPGGALDVHFANVLGFGETQAEADANVIKLARGIEIEVDGKREDLNLPFSCQSVEAVMQSKEEKLPTWKLFAKKYVESHEIPAPNPDALVANKFFHSLKPIFFQSSSGGKDQPDLTLPTKKMK